MLAARYVNCRPQDVTFAVGPRGKPALDAKEAYTKALGDGPYAPLDQFQITLLAEDPVRFVRIGSDATAAAKWTLQGLDPAPMYVGALAYQADARKIIFRGPLPPEELLEGIAA